MYLYFQGQNHPLRAKGLDVSCPHQGQKGCLEELIFLYLGEDACDIFYDLKLFFQIICKHKIYFYSFNTFLYVDVTATVPREDMCCFG